MKKILAIAFILSSMTAWASQGQGQLQNQGQGQTQVQAPACTGQCQLQNQGQGQTQVQSPCGTTQGQGCGATQGQTQVQSPGGCGIFQGQAQAQGQSQGQMQAQIQSPFAGSRSLTLAELKDSCLNPGHYNAQRAPEQIKIMCSDCISGWVPVQGPGQSLTNGRTITTAVVSDKYHVNSFCGNYDAGSTLIGITSFEEVVQSYTVEKMMTCEEIINFEGDLKDLCLTILDEEAVDESLVQGRKTGRSFRVSTMR